jgi:hypothetical protein
MFDLSQSIRRLKVERMDPCNGVGEGYCCSLANLNHAI